MTDRQRAETEHKRERVPVGGQRLRTQLSNADLEKLDEAGYIPRWFSDTAGRVQAALAGGWEFILPEEARSIGQHSLYAENSSLDSKVSIVDKNNIHHVLMKITKEFYYEDQQRKEERNAMVDRALRPVDKGGATIDRGYTPDI